MRLGARNQSAITKTERLLDRRREWAEEKKRGLEGMCDRASDIQTQSNEEGQEPEVKYDSMVSASSSRKRTLPDG